MASLSVKTEYRILGVSFLALFLELILIRYLAVEMRIFQFFKNFVLMACFLGLGLGFGMTRSKRDLMGNFIPLAGLLFLIALMAEQLQLNTLYLPTGANAFQFTVPPDADGWWNLVRFYLSSMAIITLIVAAFMPLGQKLGRLFAGLSPATSYAWDLMGSILGVLAYTASSWAEISPKVTGVVALLAGLLLVRSQPRRLAAGFVVVAVLTGLFLTVNVNPPSYFPPGVSQVTPYRWSPYYRINLETYPVSGTAEKPLHTGYMGFINGVYYFDLLDLRLAADPSATITRWGRTVPMSVVLGHYSAPYRLRPRPSRVLILGGGPGNDAAAALLNDAQDVTAVEIDPEVAWLGANVHPLRPYADPRVHVVVNDARAFLAQNTGQFEIVSFGHLDSLTLVSSFSGIRLDSFVYTLESLRSAFDHVQPGGISSVSFASTRFVSDKMYKLITAATGMQPLVLRDDYLRTTTFIVSKGGNTAQDAATWDTVVASINASKHIFPLTPRTQEQKDITEGANPIPTDDWPFLFLRDKKLSLYYVVALLLLLGLAAVFVRQTFRVGSMGQVNWHMFWLGGGFLLIETKSITQLGLLFGSTWMVNAIAIVGVLLMNLIGVGILLRFPHTSVKAMYTGLVITLLLNLVVSMDQLLSLSPTLRLTLATALLYCPLLFAGLIFTRSFRDSQEPALAFGSNLLGAMLGGCMEYLCIIYGFRLLWMLAFGLYVLSAIALRKPVRLAGAAG